MERFADWLVESKPATKIGLGTGILVVMYFIYALCKGGFSFAALIGSVVAFVIGTIVWTILMLAALMILTGLLGIGE